MKQFKDIEDVKNYFLIYVKESPYLSLIEKKWFATYEGKQLIFDVFVNSACNTGIDFIKYETLYHDDLRDDVIRKFKVNEEIRKNIELKLAIASIFNMKYCVLTVDNFSKEIMDDILKEHIDKKYGVLR